MKHKYRERKVLGMSITNEYVCMQLGILYGSNAVTELYEYIYMYIYFKLIMAYVCRASILHPLCDNINNVFVRIPFEPNSIFEQDFRHCIYTKMCLFLNIQLIKRADTDWLYTFDLV